MLGGGYHPGAQTSTKDVHTIRNQHAHVGLGVTAGSHPDLHRGPPPRPCSRPCPAYCGTGKVSGPPAGRTAWGKHSARHKDWHWTKRRLPGIDLSNGAWILTSTWRAGSRLSTGKSGRPRVDDSWEHRVVASDSSWDTLTHGKQHNTAHGSSQTKETI